jgi:TolB-like protein
MLYVCGFSNPEITLFKQHNLMIIPFNCLTTDGQKSCLAVGVSKYLITA